MFFRNGFELHLWRPGRGYLAHFCSVHLLPCILLQSFTASESSLDINDQTAVYIAANIVVVVVLGLFWRFLVVLDVS